MRPLRRFIPVLILFLLAICQSTVQAELMEGMSPPPNSWDIQLRYLYSDSDEFCDAAGNNMAYPCGSFKGRNHTLVVRPIFFGRKWAYHVVVPLMDTTIGGVNMEDSGMGDIVVGFARLYRSRDFNAIFAFDVKLKNGDYDPANAASPGMNQIEYQPGIFLTRFFNQGMVSQNLMLTPHFIKENKATGVKQGDYLHLRYTYGVAAGTPSRWWGIDFEAIVSSRRELNGTPVPGSATRLYSAGIEFLQVIDKREAASIKIMFPFETCNGPESTVIQIRYDKLY